MNAAVKQTIKHWHHLFPYAHIPQSEKEYKAQLEFVDKLMEFSRHSHDNRVTSLLKLVAENISLYEINKYSTAKTAPTDILKFLMEEHGLNQNDLPEIGSQSLVSKILNNERQLTKEHIGNLAKRFNVSPAVFF